jgi:DNA-binding HxlR family transcriptional regulator
MSQHPASSVYKYSRAERGAHPLRYAERLSPNFQRAVAILGKRWTHLILWLLCQHPMRFSELAAALEVVNRRVLSERLKELEAEGLVRRKVDAQATPPRVVYSLTRKGYAMGPVFEAISQWSDAWPPVDPAEVPRAERAG